MTKEHPVTPPPRERLQRLRVTNFRALAEVDVKLEPVNVIFGP